MGGTREWVGGVWMRFKKILDTLAHGETAIERVPEGRVALFACVSLTAVG